MFFFLFSDPAVKQFLLHLDEKMILGKKFVIEDLDETHLFVSAEIVPILQEKVWEIMDNNSFNIAQTNWILTDLLVTVVNHNSFYVNQSMCAKGWDQYCNSLLWKAVALN